MSKGSAIAAAGAVLLWAPMALAAATDHDGRWRAEWQCAPNILNGAGPIQESFNLTIAQGRATRTVRGVTAGNQAWEMAWRLEMQGAAVTVTVDGSDTGGARWQYRAAGAAASPTSMALTGGGFGVGSDTRRFRDCTLRLSLAEPAPASLAAAALRQQQDAEEQARRQAEAVRQADASRQRQQAESRTADAERQRVATAAAGAARELAESRQALAAATQRALDAEEQRDASNVAAARHAAEAQQRQEQTEARLADAERMRQAAEAAAQRVAADAQQRQQRTEARLADAGLMRQGAEAEIQRLTAEAEQRQQQTEARLADAERMRKAAEAASQHQSTEAQQRQQSDARAAEVERQRLAAAGAAAVRALAEAQDRIAQGERRAATAEANTLRIESELRLAEERRLREVAAERQLRNLAERQASEASAALAAAEGTASAAEAARRRSQEAATTRRAETLGMLDQRLGGTQGELVALANPGAEDARLRSAPTVGVELRTEGRAARACIAAAPDVERDFTRQALDRFASLLPRTADGRRAGVQLCSWSDDMRLFDLVFVARLRGVEAGSLNLAQFHELMMRDGYVAVGRVAQADWAAAAAAQRAAEEAERTARRAAEEAERAARRSADQAERERRIAAERAARDAELAQQHLVAERQQAERQRLANEAARQQAERLRLAEEAIRVSAERQRVERQRRLGVDCDTAADPARRVLCVLDGGTPSEAAAIVAGLPPSARRGWLPLVVLMHGLNGDVEDAGRLLADVEAMTTRSILARLVLAQADRFEDPAVARGLLAQVRPEEAASSAVLQVAAAFDAKENYAEVAALLPGIVDPELRSALAAWTGFRATMDRRCDAAPALVRQVGAGPLREMLALLPALAC